MTLATMALREAKAILDGPAQLDPTVAPEWLVRVAHLVMVVLKETKEKLAFLAKRA